MLLSAVYLIWTVFWCYLQADIQKILPQSVAVKTSFSFGKNTRFCFLLAVRNFPSSEEQTGTSIYIKMYVTFVCQHKQTLMRMHAFMAQP